MNKYPAIILIVVSLLAVACNKNFINLKCDKLDISIIEDSVSYANGDTIVINLEVYHNSPDISKYPISAKLFDLIQIPCSEYMVDFLPYSHFVNISKDTLIMLNAFAKDTIRTCFTSDSIIPRGYFDYEIYLHCEVGFINCDSVYKYNVASADSIIINIK